MAQVFSGFGGFISKQSEAKALKDQAQQSFENAKTAKLQAQNEAELQVLQSRKLLGEQTAGFAAAGVEGGSVFAVMADSMINAEMDRLSILYGGDIRSENFSAQGSSQRRGASNLKTASFFDFMAGATGAYGKAQGS